MWERIFYALAGSNGMFTGSVDSTHIKPSVIVPDHDTEFTSNTTLAEVDLRVHYLLRQYQNRMIALLIALSSTRHRASIGCDLAQ